MLSTKNITGALFLFSCLFLGGCNTMEGIGTDIKQGGAALERTADRNKPKDDPKTEAAKT